MKSGKSIEIIKWGLTGVLALVFIGSGVGKLIGNEEMLKMAASFGLNAKIYFILGVVELLSLTLFIIPKTGIIGSFLLAAYMGGAIATHLEHGISILAPCIIQFFLLSVAFFRFPVLRTNLFNSNS